MPKVLISDKLSKKAEEIFRKNGIEVTINTALSPEELSDIINEYDGLAIRSNTKVTPEIIKHAKKFKSYWTSRHRSR
jgi:D-3-phosphoglycerate dehydrogenase